MTASAQLLHDMVRREGFSATPYQDSEGLWTRGIGEHDGITQASQPVTFETAIANLGKRLEQALSDASDIVGAATFNALDTVRREAIVDLSYNLGRGGLASFTPVIQFIRNGAYASAAYHLLVNMSGQIQKYEREVGARGVEIALRIATGTILPEQICTP